MLFRVATDTTGSCHIGDTFMLLYVNQYHNCHLIQIFFFVCFFIISIVYLSTRMILLFFVFSFLIDKVTRRNKTCLVNTLLFNLFLTKVFFKKKKRSHKNTVKKKCQLFYS